jgi:hypothetical protein
MNTEYQCTVNKVPLIILTFINRQRNIKSQRKPRPKKNTPFCYYNILAKPGLKHATYGSIQS